MLVNSLWMSGSLLQLFKRRLKVDTLMVDEQQTNAELVRHMVQSQRNGRGCLPFFLGLNPLNCIWLLQETLGACDSDRDAQPEHARQYVTTLVDIKQPENREAYKRGTLRQELLEMRRDEWQDLRELLLANCSGRDAMEIYLADVVAAGCLGGDHLWRDLGLPDRDALSRLLQLNFPSLAEKNVHNMKWKKFFYKQLCEQEGSYVCRAPSCEVCAAYDDCFGPEH